VLERAAQGAQSERLAADEAVQYHAHDQRLIAARLPHLIELIDDGIEAKSLASTWRPMIGRTVVQFLGVRHR
jgi:hypothetical protein